MSRTDVHRPWRVQVADPYNRHLLYRFQVWPWQHELLSYRNLGCGCAMCTGRHWREKARQQERRSARRACALARQQYAAGQLDEDGPYIPRAQL